MDNMKSIIGTQAPIQPVHKLECKKRKKKKKKTTTKQQKCLFFFFWDLLMPIKIEKYN